MTSHTLRRAVALFSGGLDSILAAKLIQAQGVDVVGLHFVSPFFGHPEKIPHWEATYALPLQPVDISETFVAMLTRRPQHGFGSVMNPCVDCKILMLRRARSIMEEKRACCIVSGEVLGQRPMSQRRDSLNVIRRDAGVRDCLLRPLSALRLDPTESEIAGLIDRTQLLAISGRGRKEQMALAERFGLREIPAPAGGCLLTEQENARVFWPVLTRIRRPGAADFRLSRTGRQFWHGLRDASPESVQWLIIGRNQDDNTALMDVAEEGDLLFKVRDFSGPIGLGRRLARRWDAGTVEEAATLIASYAPKCMRSAAESGERVAVRVHSGSLDIPGTEVLVAPRRESLFWQEPAWPDAHEDIRAEARAAAISKES